MAKNSAHILLILTNHSATPITPASAEKARMARIVFPSGFINAFFLHARPSKKFFKYPLITTPTGIDRYPMKGKATKYMTDAAPKEIMLVFTGVLTSWLA